MTATPEPIWTVEPTVVNRTTDPNHPLRANIQLMLRNPAGGDPIAIREIVITVGDDLLFSAGGVQPGAAPDGWDFTQFRGNRNQFLAEPADGEAHLLDGGSALTFGLRELQVSEKTGAGYIHLAAKIEGKSEGIKQSLSVEKQEPAFTLSLQANPLIVDGDETVTLSWKLGVGEATLVLFGPEFKKEGLSVTGRTQQEVHPRTTATYTLKATHNQAERRESVTVQVVDPGALDFEVKVIEPDVAAHTPKLGVGDTAVLRWRAPWAASCNLAITVDSNPTLSIDGLQANAIDPVKPDEADLRIECQVKLSDGKTLVVDAARAGGKIETFTLDNPIAKIIKFMVVPVKAGKLRKGHEIPVSFLKPEITEFTGSSNLLELGDPLHLTWKANHFESLILTGAPGGLEKPLAAAGTLDLTPQDSTKYVLTAKGGSVVDKREWSVHIPVRVWQTLPSMPTGRFNLAAVGTPDGYIYALGGAIELGYPSVYGNTVERFDPRTREWKAMPPMLAAYSDFEAVALPDGMIYVFGLKYTTKWRDDVTLSFAERYDPKTGVSVPIRPPHPYRRHCTVVATPDGMIYMIGGMTVGSGTTVERYDPRTDTWSASPALCTERSFCGAAALADGSIYVFGGAWQEPRWERRDPASGQWSFKPHMAPFESTPTTMVRHRAFVINKDLIYVFSDPMFGSDRVKNIKAQRYSMSAETWQSLPEGPAVERYGIAPGADGNIYLMGGFNSGPVHQPILNLLVAYGS